MNETIKNNLLTEEKIFSNNGYLFDPVSNKFVNEKPDSEIEIGINEEGEVYEK